MRHRYIRWHRSDLWWESGYGGDERMSLRTFEWVSYAKGTVRMLRFRWNRAHINKCRRHRKGLRK